MKIMNIKQFLQNPSGPYSSSFARRDLIIANMEDRFAKLLKERKNDFKVMIFQGKEKNDFIFYFKIPSEKYNNLSYDVVLQFIPIDMNCIQSKNIDNYAIKVFSNSLNFTYTYAYVYNKDDIIINDLKDKISKEALTQEPVIKNQNFIYGYEKSVYFALLYLKANNLNQKFTINSFIKPNTSLAKVKPMIKSSNSKIMEYNMIKKKDQEEKKEQKKKTKKQTTVKKYKF